jgi:lipid A disaccharide synthetase
MNLLLKNNCTPMEVTLIITKFFINNIISFIYISLLNIHLNINKNNINFNKHYTNFYNKLNEKNKNIKNMNKYILKIKKMIYKDYNLNINLVIEKFFLLLL